MPIPPRPITFKCPNCHWQRSYASPSDALCLPPWATQCPRCGHEGMRHKPASAIESIKARLLDFLG